MFAVRETLQESLGFSPIELVFGHQVRGPLKLLREQLLSVQTTPVPVAEYVDSFRRRLHLACDFAKANLELSQSKMKTQFDRKSVARSFQPDDSVLIFLPVQGSALQAKYSGPYLIEKKLSDTDYVLHTPDRRRKSRVCHINMLKSYVARDVPVSNPLPNPVPVASVVPLSLNSPEEDGLTVGDAQTPCVRLQNSAVLDDLSAHLAHLPELQRRDIVSLIEKYPTLFSDVPSQTNVLCHDIDVGNSPPIKQHSYRVNPHKCEVMRAEVDYLVKNGFARPSQSPWSSPCLLVPKPDSTYRFCTDYRKVNNVTKPDSFPLPLMEDCVDRVGAACYVTKLDLLKGYWQVPLTPQAWICDTR